MEGTRIGKEHRAMRTLLFLGSRCAHPCPMLCAAGLCSSSRLCSILLWHSIVNALLDCLSLGL